MRSLVLVTGKQAIGHIPRILERSCWKGTKGGTPEPSGVHPRPKGTLHSWLEPRCLAFGTDQLVELLVRLAGQQDVNLP
jgi:hypothetical protein